MATLTKDTNFNMRMNRRKKSDLEFNREAEAAIQEARDIMSGKADAKSYSSFQELFDDLDGY